MSAGSESISAKGDKMTRQSVVKLRLWLALFVSVAFVAFAPQQVTVDSLPGTDFAGFKTYVWRISPQPIPDVAWNGRIISNVDGQLAAKGLKKVGPDGNPDLVVFYIAGNTPTSPSEQATYAAGPSGTIQKVEQNEASLKVYLEDTHAHAVVWCALGTDALADTSDQNIRKLEKLVQEMFKNYPPAK